MLSSSANVHCAESTDDSFYGWACAGKGKPLEWRKLALKKFEDNDVEIEITHCGICASDISTLDNKLGPTDYPCVVGHEIAGIVGKVGSKVSRFKVGDRVGVGPQSGCCSNCQECKAGKENYCRNGCVTTYNSRWPSGDKTYGGYADRWRGNETFVYKVPDSMPNEVAATLLCAGATPYVAMKQHNVGKDSRVGVIGIGGLGHLAIQLGKSMGARVTAISSSDKKREDAKLLGADNYLVMSSSSSSSTSTTSSSVDEAKTSFIITENRCKNALSHLILTMYRKENFDWGKYLDLLEPGGVVIILALPDGPFSGIPQTVVMRNLTLSGSFIASPSDTQEMLKLAAEKGVKPWTQNYPMEKATEAVQAMREGKAKFRIVLENKTKTSRL